MQLIRHLLALMLMLCSLPALAVNYVFPGNLPPGCTGSGSSYTCPGGGGLAYNDTVTVASATPITVTVTGNMNTSNGRINQGGSASNLTIRVNGTLTAEFQAVINANVQATVVDSSDGEVTFGGNITTTTGAITLGYNNTVSGNITSTSGAISIGGITQVAGQVSCNCALTLDYDARVSGSISAATVVTDGRAYLMGSVTTTGNVDVGYQSTLGGAVTAGGTIRLRGNIVTSQCLRSTSSSTITLAWADRANGGVCCGALGSCTTSCVNNGSGAPMPALCTPASTPGRFNAFDTATASGTTGYIKTKVSGTAFSVAIVAINTAGTAVATTFTGNVRVEVLDSANDSGALNSTTGCRASWGVASGTSATTLSFAASDAGRKNLSLTVADAFPNARIRVSYPDTGTATVIGCSADNFAIRPASFELASGASSWGSDTDWASTGTARQLNNLSATGGAVHKAGQPFTLRARALNGASIVTANYTGTPTANTYGQCAGTACYATYGALTVTPTATAGVINATASYSEAGSFNLQLNDTTFANVDVADGSTASERTISSAFYPIGRFVPDHFDVVSLQTPVFRTFNNNTCTSRSFTYLGQPFGYQTRPQASVLARNLAGTTTTNYPNAKLSALSITQTYAIGSSGPGLDTTLVTLPGLAASGSGVATLDAASTDTLAITRHATTPVAPFDTDSAGYNISLRWQVSDTTESAYAGNGSGAGIVTTSTTTWPVVDFDSGSVFRYGQLKLGSAYGSELIPLAVPMETQYWNGTSFVTNTLDSCTTLPTSSVSLANFRGSLAACETAPTSASLAFASGRATMRLAAAGNGNKGSVDGTVQLGATITAGALRCSAVGASASAAVAAALPWLQSKAPGGTTFDQNPSARFSFGQYRSPLIQLREMY